MASLERTIDVPARGNAAAIFTGRIHFHTVRIEPPGVLGIFVANVDFDEAVPEVRIRLGNMGHAARRMTVVLEGVVNLDEPAEVKAASASAIEALAESFGPPGGTGILTARELAEAKERNRDQREAGAWTEAVRYAAKASRDAADDGELGFRFLCHDSVDERMIAHLRTLGYSLGARRTAFGTRDYTMIDVEVAP
jgi:hypothetical protein